MICSLSGKLTTKRGNYAALDVHGVEFKVFLSSSALANLPQAGSSVKILTHLHVREDELSLFGFLKDEELELFESLISVSGIGPKSAMAVMSVAPVDKIKAAISEGEIDLLQKVSGVGKKTAERIILELKDKVSALGGADKVKVMAEDNDVYEALTSMGYSAKQAKDAISKIKHDTKSTSERLKEALRIIKS